MVIPLQIHKGILKLNWKLYKSKNLLLNQTIPKKDYCQVNATSMAKAWVHALWNSPYAYGAFTLGVRDSSGMSTNTEQSV
jgi:hypothetical protein